MHACGIEQDGDFMGGFRWVFRWMSVTGIMYNFSDGVGGLLFYLFEIITVDGSYKCKQEYVKYSLGGISIKPILILTHVN